MLAPSVNVYAQDFRSVSYGMTIDKVREAESIVSETVDLNGYLGLLKEVTVGGFDAEAYYYFIDSTFVAGIYIFLVEHTNENLYISDFQKIKNILTSLYGEPYTDHENWNNSLYKNNPEKHGFAVSIGHLLYMTVWKVINYDSLTENKVGVMLTGDNYEIKLNAMYTSMDYDKKMEAIKSKQLKKDF